MAKQVHEQNHTQTNESEGQFQIDSAQQWIDAGAELSNFSLRFQCYNLPQQTRLTLQKSLLNSNEAQPGGCRSIFLS